MKIILASRILTRHHILVCTTRKKYNNTYENASRRLVYGGDSVGYNARGDEADTWFFFFLERKIIRLLRRGGDDLAKVFCASTQVLCARTRQYTSCLHRLHVTIYSL